MSWLIQKGKPIKTQDTKTNWLTSFNYLFPTVSSGMFITKFPENICFLEVPLQVPHDCGAKEHFNLRFIANRISYICSIQSWSKSTSLLRKIDQAK
ncbi:hypothetical protein L1887_28723 [Cichorium endivia]|nr:hypothetical protein L1887_28723 [Cichorium endivia]